MVTVRVAVAAPTRELRMRRLRHEELDLEAPALDLCLDDSLPHAVRPTPPATLVA